MFECFEDNLISRTFKNLKYLSFSCKTEIFERCHWFFTKRQSLRNISANYNWKIVFKSQKTNKETTNYNSSNKIISYIIIPLCS